MTEPSPTFRLAYIPGVTPGKWVRIWEERHPDVALKLVAATAAQAPTLLEKREVAAALLRLPIERDGLSVITLYTETSVVVAPTDHVIAAADEVSIADLADETVLYPRDDRLEWNSTRPGTAAAHRPDTTGEAIELVAAGIGVVVVPQSLARLHHRRDLTYRTVRDGPTSPVALALAGRGDHRPRRGVRRDRARAHGQQFPWAAADSETQRRRAGGREAGPPGPTLKDQIPEPRATVDPSPNSDKELVGGDTTPPGVA